MSAAEAIVSLPDDDCWTEPARMSDEDRAMCCELVRHGERLSPPVAARLLEHIRALNRDISGLRQSLDDATGPHCSSCGNAIDPDCCHCGDSEAGHGGYDSHPFVPMGCVCGYHEQDWKRQCGALRERLWAANREIERLNSAVVVLP